MPSENRSQVTEAMVRARRLASDIVRRGAPGCGNGNKIIADEIKGGLHDDYFIVRAVAEALAEAPSPENRPQVTEAMVNAGAAAYADATDYYLGKGHFHRGLSSPSADKIRRGVRAALEAAFAASPSPQPEAQFGPGDREQLAATILSNEMQAALAAAPWPQSGAGLVRRIVADGLTAGASADRITQVLLFALAAAKPEQPVQGGEAMDFSSLHRAAARNQGTRLTPEEAKALSAALRAAQPESRP